MKKKIFNVYVICIHDNNRFFDILVCHGIFYNLNYRDSFYGCFKTFMFKVFINNSNLRFIKVKENILVYFVEVIVYILYFLDNLHIEHFSLVDIKIGNNFLYGFQIIFLFHILNNVFNDGNCIYFDKNKVENEKLQKTEVLKHGVYNFNVVFFVDFDRYSFLDQMDYNGFDVMINVVFINMMKHNNIIYNPFLD